MWLLGVLSLGRSVSQTVARSICSINRSLSCSLNRSILVCVCLFVCVHACADGIGIARPTGAMTCTWYYQRHFAGVGTCFHLYASDLIYGSVLSERMTHEERFFNLWAGYLWECCQYMLTSKSYRVIDTAICLDCLGHCPGIFWLLAV